MKESEFHLVKENMFDNPLCSEMDSILNNCFSDCHNNFFHKFKYECIYDIEYKNIVKNEMINFAVSGKTMDLNDLNKLNVARENGFIFMLINKQTKIHSPLRYIKISYCLKFPIPIMHRQFFKTISQNKQYYVEIFCNDKSNHFHFACQKGLNHLN